MTWRPALSLIPAVCIATAVAGAVPAQADEVDPGDSPEPSVCHFSLSPPQLVDWPSGGQAVQATIAPRTCDGVAEPANSSLCLREIGVGTTTCDDSFAWIPAEVVVPLRPGQQYTVTGDGCSLAVASQEQICEPAGPFTATF